MMPLDKQAHFLSGFVITNALSLVLPLWLALCAAFAAGALKELYDYYHPLTHTCDANDFYATAAGGVLAAVWVLFANFLITFGR